MFESACCAAFGVEVVLVQLSQTLSSNVYYRPRLGSMTSNSALYDNLDGDQSFSRARNSIEPIAEGQHAKERYSGRTPCSSEYFTAANSQSVRFDIRYALDSIDTIYGISKISPAQIDNTNISILRVDS